MITPEQRKQIIRELIETWDYIGGDILQNIAMEKVGWVNWDCLSDKQRWKAAEAVTMKQADVTCVVRDNWCGKISNDHIWFKLPETVKDAIAKEAFPYKYYGY